MALRSLNIFTDEFFARLDPGFFKGLADLSTGIGDLGLFGIVGSLVSASFLFSTLITTVNQIFRTNYHRSFVYNRLIEFLLMAVVGIFMFFSLAMTAVWTALGRTLESSELVRTTLNPEAVVLINNVFLKYLIPYALGVLMFFVLYKFVPEVKVHTRAALIPADRRRPALRGLQAGLRLLRHPLLRGRHRPQQDPPGHADLGPVLPAVDHVLVGHPAVGGGAGRRAEREVRGRRGRA